MRNRRRGECILVSLGCGCVAVSTLAVVGLVALFFLWGSNYSSDPAKAESIGQEALPGLAAMPGCHSARAIKVGRSRYYVTLGDTAAGDTYSVYMEATPNRNDPNKVWKTHAPTPTGGKIDTQLVDLNVGGRHETVLRSVEKGNETFRLGLMGHGRAIDLQIDAKGKPFDRQGLQHFLDGLNLQGYSSYASTQGDRLRYYRWKGPEPSVIEKVKLGMTKDEVQALLGIPPLSSDNRLLYNAGQILIGLDEQGKVREIVAPSMPGVDFATKIDTLGSKAEPITFLDQIDQPGTFLRAEDGQVTKVITRR